MLQTTNFHDNVTSKLKTAANFFPKEDGHGGKTADWLKNPLSWSMLKRSPLTICGCKQVSKMSEHFASGSIEQQEILWIFTQLEPLLVTEYAD